MTHGPIVERFRAARSDPRLVVVEGFHALKHALRFGAEILEVVATDPEAAVGLAARLAPDVEAAISDLIDPVPSEAFRELVPSPPTTAVVALARRRETDADGVLGDPADAPVVFLERPRRPGNVGAAIRVAAAAEAAGVLVSGPVDPWGAPAVRGAAGLQFALPVARVERVPATDRPLAALDPGGEPLGREAIPSRSVLGFGTERDGLSQTFLEEATAHVRIPMRAGVSSLNLATAVAAALYLVRRP